MTDCAFCDRQYEPWEVPSGHTLYLSNPIRTRIRRLAPELRDWIAARGKGEFTANIESDLRMRGEHNLANTLKAVAAHISKGHFDGSLTPVSDERLEE